MIGAVGRWFFGTARPEVVDIRTPWKHESKYSTCIHCAQPIRTRVLQGLVMWVARCDLEPLCPSDPDPMRLFGGEHQPKD